MGVKIIYTEQSPVAATPAFTFAGTTSSAFPVVSEIASNIGVLLRPLVITATYADPPLFSELSYVTFYSTGSVYAKTVTVTATPSESGQAAVSETYSIPTGTAAVRLAVPAPSGVSGLHVGSVAIAISELSAFDDGAGTRMTITVDHVTMAREFVWTDDDLAEELEICEDIDIGCLSLPYDTSSFSVNIPRSADAPRFAAHDSIAYYHVSDNTETWLAEHYVSEVKRGVHKYDVTAMSAIGVLDDYAYNGGRYVRHASSGDGPGPMYTLQDILQDILPAGMAYEIAFTPITATDWDYYVIRNADILIRPGSVREALAQFSCALGASIKSRGWSIVVDYIPGLPAEGVASTDTATEISADDIFDQHDIELIDVSSIVLGIKEYATQYSGSGTGDPDTLWKGYTYTTEAYHVQFEEMGLVGDVEHGTAIMPDFSTYIFGLDIIADDPNTEVNVTGTPYKIEEIRTVDIALADGPVHTRLKRIDIGDCVSWHAWYQSSGASLESILARWAQTRLYHRYKYGKDMFKGKIRRTTEQVGDYVTLTLPGVGTITGWISSLRTKVRAGKYADIDIIGTFTEEDSE